MSRNQHWLVVLQAEDGLLLKWVQDEGVLLGWLGTGRLQGHKLMVGGYRHLQYTLHSWLLTSVTGLQVYKYAAFENTRQNSSCTHRLHFWNCQSVTNKEKNINTSEKNTHKWCETKFSDWQRYQINRQRYQINRNSINKAATQALKDGWLSPCPTNSKQYMHSLRLQKNKLKKRSKEDY